MAYDESRLDYHALKSRIQYHRPNKAAIEQIAQMRAKALAWANDVTIHVPAGREQQLAITHIETALMWANAGIARHPDNWDTEQPEE